MATPARLARARHEPRLDPVRWRRPGSGTLIRLVVVTALLGLAAMIAWSGPSPGPSTCSARPAPAVGSSPERRTSRPSSAADSEQHDPPSTHAVPPGSVGVPVRLAEPTALSLVRPGDRVDLLRVDDAGHGTTAVAAAALVLGVTGTDDPAAGGLLLALRPSDAEKAVAAQGNGFAVVIRPE